MRRKFYEFFVGNDIYIKNADCVVLKCRGCTQTRLTIRESLKNLTARVMFPVSKSGITCVQLVNTAVIFHRVKLEKPPRVFSGGKLLL